MFHALLQCNVRCNDWMIRLTGRTQTHKQCFLLTRRLYRVVAWGSHHTEMWRDKCEILKIVPLRQILRHCFYECYLQAPCEGRGCRGGCPCGRGAGSPDSQSRGMATVETRHDSGTLWLLLLLLLLLLLSAGLRSEMLSPLSPPPDSLWSPRNSIWIWSGCWRLQQVNNLIATKLNLHK